MAKPTIVTRAGKGSALTWTEGDANFTNLKDATIGITDGTTSGTLDLNDTLAFTAGTNITLSYNATSKALTINSTGGGSVDLSSPGPIGATTPSTGAFTTLSATTTGTSGAVNVTYNPSSTSGSAIQVTGKDSQGGTGYLDFLKTTNTTSGATNANKTFRTNSTGALEIINSGYTATILSLTDSGVLTAQSLSISKDIREAVYAIGNSGAATLTPDAANGTVQTITATGNFTLSAFTSPISGQTVTFIITQDATGGRVLTSTMKFASGSKTLSTAANSIDILTVSYIGTTYYASLSKGFA